jgi:hypothetical protein
MRVLTQRPRPSRPPAGPSRAPAGAPLSGPGSKCSQLTSCAVHAKRNSISSGNPPGPIVIPAHTHPPHLALGMDSPLSMHGSAGWYLLLTSRVTVVAWVHG